MKLNLAQPNKENLNTFVTLGSVLILVGFFDFLANTFLDLNFTGFLPGGLSFLTPIIIGVIGLHFIRIEFSGNRLLDKINTNFNSSNFNAFLSFAGTKNDAPTSANNIKKAVLIRHCSVSVYIP